MYLRHAPNFITIRTGKAVPGNCLLIMLDVALTGFQFSRRNSIILFQLPME